MKKNKGKTAKKAGTARKATPQKGPVKKAAKKMAKPVKMAASKTMKAAPVVKKNVPVVPKQPKLLTPKNLGTKQYTQAEFFDCLLGYCGFPNRKEAKNYYGAFSGMLQSALKQGYKVVLPGLGKMQVRKTKPRKGINPATREPINIPAKRKVAFTPLKALKQAVL
jgi:DNA-binding protein HU-beta